MRYHRGLSVTLLVKWSAEDIDTCYEYKDGGVVACLVFQEDLGLNIGAQLWHEIMPKIIRDYVLLGNIRVGLTRGGPKEGMGTNI